MPDEMQIFIKKAAAIVAVCPYYASENDKLATLNRKFRLNKEEAKILLRRL